MFVEITKQLLEVAKLKAGDVWKSKFGNLTNHLNLLTVLLAAQTATINTVEGETRSRTITYEALEPDCDTDTVACNTDCNVQGGTQTYIKTTSVAPTTCASHKKSVMQYDWDADNTKLRGNLANAFAKSIVAIDNVISKKVAKAMLAAFVGNQGEFLGTETLGGNVTAGTGGLPTTVANTSFNSELVGWLKMSAEQSGLEERQILVTGSNFALEMANIAAGAQANVVADAGGNVQVEGLNIYTSNFNVAQDFSIDALMGGNGSLLIDPNSYAIYFENRYASTPSIVPASDGDVQTFSVASKLIQGMKIDIRIQAVCIAKNQYQYNIEGEAHYGIDFADDFCENGWTGTLGFAKA